MKLVKIRWKDFLLGAIKWIHYINLPAMALWSSCLPHILSNNFRSAPSKLFLTDNYFFSWDLTFSLYNTLEIPAVKSTFNMSSHVSIIQVFNENVKKCLTQMDSLKPSLVISTFNKDGFWLGMMQKEATKLRTTREIITWERK